MKQCPQCNNSCDENDKVCSNCGYIFTPKEFQDDPAFNSNNQQPNQNFNQPNNQNFNQPNQPYGQQNQQPYGQQNQQPYGGANQQPYGQPQQNYAPYNNGAYNPNMNMQPQKKSNTSATASLVLGIISVVTSCCGIGFIPAVIAIILGFVSNAKAAKENPQGDNGKGMAIAGIILGFIAVAITIYYIVSFIMNKEQIFDMVNQMMREIDRYE